MNLQMTDVDASGAEDYLEKISQLALVRVSHDR